MPKALQGLGWTLMAAAIAIFVLYAPDVRADLSALVLAALATKLLKSSKRPGPLAPLMRRITEDARLHLTAAQQASRAWVLNLIAVITLAAAAALFWIYIDNLGARLMAMLLFMGGIGARMVALRYEKLAKLP